MISQCSYIVGPDKQFSLAIEYRENRIEWEAQNPAFDLQAIVEPDLA